MSRGRFAASSFTCALGHPITPLAPRTPMVVGLARSPRPRQAGQRYSFISSLAAHNTKVRPSLLLLIVLYCVLITLPVA